MYIASLLDLGTVAQEASTTYNDRMNRCFNELLLTRSSHLSRVTSDVARMATLMEKLNPSSQEYDSMLANGMFLCPWACRKTPRR